MAKSFVLKALRIFGLEELLKLSERRQNLKKAAGDDLIIFEDQSSNKPPQNNDKDNVLPFTKHPQKQEASKEVEVDKEYNSSNSNDFILLQRELAKEANTPSKKEAVKGYAKSTELYVVKKSSINDKERIRFASSKGVLINKKQA